MLPTMGQVLVVGICEWLKIKLLRGNRPDIPIKVEGSFDSRDMFVTLGEGW